MQSGKYTLRELFTNRSLEQIIIPEIQRDYVWSNEQVEDLISSLLEDFEKNQTAIFNAKSDDHRITELFKEFYKKQKYSTNIGFIYAYNDEEYADKYFLIDGQQRLTTMYLILLALTEGDYENKNEFENGYFPKHNDNNKGKLKLDYKVRESAHDFFQRFVMYILDSKDIKEITNQYWYHNEYKSDITIGSILNNFETIRLKLCKVNKKDFFAYIQNYVNFWYFDTSISEQGEELYIYMNARGEQTQPNENIKAKLLGSLTEDEVARFVSSRDDYNEITNLSDLKNFWGKKWEGWQDFFFQHSGETRNADIGFNEFLKCLDGFNYFKNNSLSINLDMIEIYYTAIFRITEHCPSFDWAIKCKNELIKIIYKGFVRNEKETDWFVAGDEKKGVDNSRMVFVWSILEYLKGPDINIALTQKEIRALRLFWLRYNNYDRSIAKLLNKIESLKKVDGLFGINEDFSEDEKLKHIYYINNLGLNEMDDFHENEMIIWKIEEHPLNIDGRDFKAINISHLIDFNKNPTTKELEKVNTKFIELFPVDTKIPCNELKTLLLYYSSDNEVYWNKVSPYYYENYDCSDWRRTIRKSEFKEFFIQYFNEKNIEKQIKECQIMFFSNKTVDEIRKFDSKRSQIIIYTNLIVNIWDKGNVAFYGNIEPGTTRIFEKELRIYQSSRYYDNSTELWGEIVKLVENNSTVEYILQDLIDRYSEYQEEY